MAEVLRVWSEQKHRCLDIISRFIWKRGALMRSGQVFLKSKPTPQQFHFSLEPE